MKGISLFLSPKFLVGDDGSLGDRNRMSVGSLEHKMGIHGQPTCVMNYDGAIGWLVGEPGRGLNAMFTMMNAERLFVGIQGLGIGEAAIKKPSLMPANACRAVQPMVRAAPCRLLSTRMCAKCFSPDVR